MTAVKYVLGWLLGAVAGIFLAPMLEMDILSGALVVGAAVATLEAAYRLYAGDFQALPSAVVAVGATLIACTALEVNLLWVVLPAVVLVVIYVLRSVGQARQPPEEGIDSSLVIQPPGIGLKTILKLTGGDHERAVDFLEWIAGIAAGERGRAVRDIVKIAAKEGWSESTVVAAIQAASGERPPAREPPPRQGFFQRRPPASPNALFGDDDWGEESWL